MLRTDIEEKAFVHVRRGSGCCSFDMLKIL
jgi:hypothetical protein